MPDSQILNLISIIMKHPRLKKILEHEVQSLIELCPALVSETDYRYDQEKIIPFPFSAGLSEVDTIFSNLRTSVGDNLTLAKQMEDFWELQVSPCRKRIKIS